MKYFKNSETLLFLSEDQFSSINKTRLYDISKTTLIICLDLFPTLEALLSNVRMLALKISNQITKTKPIFSALKKYLVMMCIGLLTQLNKMKRFQTCHSWFIRTSTHLKSFLLMLRFMRFIEKEKISLILIKSGICGTFKMIWLSNPTINGKDDQI